MGRRLITLPRAKRVPLMKRGVFGAFVAYFSFGAILLATRLDRVGEAAVLRETSTVFAALIGWTILGDLGRKGRAQRCASDGFDCGRGRGYGMGRLRANG